LNIFVRTGLRVKSRANPPEHSLSLSQTLSRLAIDRESDDDRVQ
jgi:hypothetical protein